MFVEFDQINSGARVWVYQLDRKLSIDELEVVATAVKGFCEQWSAHGSPLVSSYTIQLNQYLVLAVDEKASNASGCSIDGSVRLLKELGIKLGVDFMNREVPFLIDGEVKLYPMTGLKTLFESGALKSDTITFNNLVCTKADWERGWRLEASSSWMAKYLPKTTLA